MFASNLVLLAGCLNYVIAEKISEAVKIPYNNNNSTGSQIVTAPSILTSVLLCFRVMLLRVSNLSSFWPIITHEIVQVKSHYWRNHKI